MGGNGHIIEQMNKKIKLIFAIPIVLIGVILLVNCSSTKDIGNAKLKTKDILGYYELDSLSRQKNYINDSILGRTFLPVFLSKSIIIDRRNQLFYQVPYRGDNGITNKIYRRGNWKSNSDTLFLTFGSKDDKNTKEEAYLFQTDSLVLLDSQNDKVYIKRNK